MKKNKEEKNTTLRNISIGSACQENVDRFGSANAEFIKAYTGFDQELGKTLDKGLKEISEYKVNEKYRLQNIKQQAGFAAEVHKTASTNAENIIQKNDTRLFRTDDIPEVYGKNNTVFDHVEVDSNGNLIVGSESQMKLVSDPKNLLNKIAKGNSSRYLKAKLDLPSEQVNSAKKHCIEQAKKLREQAERLDLEGKTEIASLKREQAQNFDYLHDNIRDMNMTTEEAIFYREHPTVGTAIDIAKTSHRAGLEGAKFGLAIGGAVSTVKNIVAFYQDDKDLRDALLDTTLETSKAATVGYATTFTGSAVKGLMQQSGNAGVRALSRTSLPTMTVSICLELGSAINKYIKGDIDSVEFFERIGEKGSSILSSGMGATVGQMAIPIPIVGAMIGGMIGYTLSSMAYNDALSAFKDAKQAREDYLRIKCFCEQARENMEAYRVQLNQLIQEWITESRNEIENCLQHMDAMINEGDIDKFAKSANELAEYIGGALQFENKKEFDEFMASNETLII